MKKEKKIKRERERKISVCVCVCVCVCVEGGGEGLFWVKPLFYNLKIITTPKLVEEHS